VTGAVEFVIRRTKPREGWLPLLLLLAIVGCVNAAVLEATWVPEDGIVIPATLAGLLLGSVLAKRPLSTFFAWILLTLYGAFISLIVLANLLPSWAALRGGWESLRQYWGGSPTPYIYLILYLWPIARSNNNLEILQCLSFP
jgi:hypothetical protein